MGKIRWYNVTCYISTRQLPAGEMSDVFVTVCMISCSRCDVRVTRHIVSCCWGEERGPARPRGCLSSVSPSRSEYDGRILMLNNSTMSWTLSKMKKRIFTLCFLFIMPINVPSSVRLWSSHAKFAPCLPLVYISSQATECSTRAAGQHVGYVSSVI